MEQDNFSELFTKFSQMMENGEVPDNIKNMINTFSNSSGSDVNANINSENSNQSNDFSQSASSSSNDNSFNFDFETFMKLQSIMNKINSKKNDPRTNLLRSLEPYLKDSRKKKVEQYINMLKMAEIVDFLSKSGGDIL